MGVSLPAMRLTLLAVVLSVYGFHFSLRSLRQGDSIHSGHQPECDHNTHKQEETEMDPTHLEMDRDTSPPSSKQVPDSERTTTLTGAISQNAKDDSPQVSSQAPMNANGFFNGASDFVVYQPVMNNIHGAKDKVLQWLAKFTMHGAEFDARGHVPGCHPGTRIKILEKLQHGIDGAEHTHRILWLHGPAGVGKSAILQSLAERLSEVSNLGATLFFSRPNGRHDPDFVIPTISYQLAVRIPKYKEYVRQTMANDPRLLEKDMEHQFVALIAEPLTKFGLTKEGQKWVVLLDGLDECRGEDAQILIVKLIACLTCQYPTAPLIWVIASRPEAHLQGVFNSEGVMGSFEVYEVLANSDEACRDVEKFLRAKFEEIRQHYRDLMPIGTPWPAEQDIARVSETSSGLFALAVTITHYVNDPDTCDPISQLATVLSVTEGLEPGSLSALYALYSAILAGVPRSMSPIVKLLLIFYATVGEKSSLLIDDDNDDNDGSDNYPLVLFATIFKLKQHTVYGALRKLHSVIKVPSLEESGRRGIKFYHASFPDYLKTLEGYLIDVDIIRAFWWGWFAIIHGGDSAVYQDAISDCRPPVLLSWDVRLASSVSRDLWRRGIRHLLHLVLPECSLPGRRRGFDHPHLSSNTNELQIVFEKFNFSTLIFEREGQLDTLEDLIYLFEWLVGTTSPEILQSTMVKKVLIRELDFTCIPGAKFSYEAEWFRSKDGTVIFGSQSPKIYSAISSQGPDQDREDDVFPIQQLVPKLDKFRNENPATGVLVVGGRPSRRCVLIYVQPTDHEDGLFYYVPYCG